MRQIFSLTISSHGDARCGTSARFCPVFASCQMLRGYQINALIGVTLSIYLGYNGSIKVYDNFEKIVLQVVHIPQVTRILVFVSHPRLRPCPCSPLFRVSQGQSCILLLLLLPESAQHTTLSTRTRYTLRYPLKAQSFC
jgi:hypothetical protein